MGVYLFVAILVVIFIFAVSAGAISISRERKRMMAVPISDEPVADYYQYDSEKEMLVQGKELRNWMVVRKFHTRGDWIRIWELKGNGIGRSHFTGEDAKGNNARYFTSDLEIWVAKKY